MDLSIPVFPKASDPLGELLHQLRLDGSLYCRSTLQGQWSIAMPLLPSMMMFHIVTEGTCWLTPSDGKFIRLKRGTLVLMSKGSNHVISSNPKLLPKPLFEYDVVKISERFETLDIKGDGKLVKLTCGVVGFNQFASKHLIQQLPEFIMLKDTDHRCEEWLSSTLELIGNEAKDLKPGGETIITHLADVLILKAIRHWMESAPESNCGWVGGLKDKNIGIALSAIHNQPQKRWTVDLLARSCGMSRSGFSAHFKKIVGKSVKNYLTEWRMHLAHQRLRFKQEPLIVLAESLGYQSEAAFSRAFKRVIGITPGSVETI